MNHGIRRTRGSHGGIAVAALVLVVVCMTVSAGALLSNVGATRESETLLARERAFQAAEAGLDWAVTRMRIGHGSVPSTRDETGAVGPAASYAVHYAPGTSDGIDENGNGVVDDAGESDYSCVTSTGTSGGVRRTVQAILRRAVIVPDFPGGALIDDVAPVLDLNGNAFTFSGAEHFIDGTIDVARPARFGIASLAAPAVLASQVNSSRWDRITGAGGVPAVGQTVPVDLSRLIAQASQAASRVLTSGTYTDQNWGTPTPEGIQVILAQGDLHLSGGAQGAGVLIVDGDLTISGGFEWVGIVLVRGRTTNLVGGGSGTRLIGALVTSDELRTTGTVDVKYSSDAVALASLALAIPVVVTWRETGAP